MQIAPTSALLHALSRVGENAPAQAPRQPVSPRPDTATDPTRAVTTPDAAKAAARAAFQALRPAQPVPVTAVTQPQPLATPPQQPAKQLPRGSFLNLVV